MHYTRTNILVSTDLLPTVRAEMETAELDKEVVFIQNLDAQSSTGAEPVTDEYLKSADTIVVAGATVENLSESQRAKFYEITTLERVHGYFQMTFAETAKQTPTIQS